MQHCRFFAFIVLFATLSIFVTGQAVPTNLVTNAKLPPNFVAWRWSIGVQQARGFLVLPTNDIIVIEKGPAKLTILWDGNNDLISNRNTERAVLAVIPGLNHGIAYSKGYLYVSNATHVLRWVYNYTRTPLPAPTVVIRGFPDGGHATRTLAFDAKDYLYVGVGSASNVDSNSLRSRVMRYKITRSTRIPTGGFSWLDGEVFVDGTRNVNGFRIDRYGRMWGVENGCDNLQRVDLGGDIHNDNPGEEINLFPPLNSTALVNATAPGHFYGYPYCWSEFNLNHSRKEGPTAQWAHPNFIRAGTHNDTWCKNPANVVRPAFVLPAHTAPLDMFFYEKGKNYIRGTWPNTYYDNAFVTMHGSWNRDPPIGYRVEYVVFDKVTRKPVSSQPFFSYNGTSAKASDWPIKPVGLGFINCGAVYGDCLLVSSDTSGDIIAIAYKK